MQICAPPAQLEPRPHLQHVPNYGCRLLHCIQPGRVAPHVEDDRSLRGRVAGNVALPRGTEDDRSLRRRVADKVVALPALEQLL